VRKLLLLAIVALVVFVGNAQRIALAEQNIFTKLPDSWKQLDADYFTIYAPATWKFRKLQGIDSYVGEFVADGVRLEFDYGLYSNSIPAEAKEPTYTVVEEKIGGHLAKIVCPKTPGPRANSDLLSGSRQQNQRPFPRCRRPVRRPAENSAYHVQDDSLPASFAIESTLITNSVVTRV
jgi:hypothetical protein